MISYMKPLTPTSRGIPSLRWWWRESQSVAPRWWDSEWLILYYHYHNRGRVNNKSSVFLDPIIRSSGILVSWQRKEKATEKVSQSIVSFSFHTASSFLLCPILQQSVLGSSLCHDDVDDIPLYTLLFLAQHYSNFIHIWWTPFIQHTGEARRREPMYQS